MVTHWQLLTAVTQLAERFGEKTLLFYKQNYIKAPFLLVRDLILSCLEVLRIRRHGQGHSAIVLLVSPVSESMGLLQAQVRSRLADI